MLAKSYDERDELTRQLAELVTAIDEHLVVAHIGVFNQGDDPKAALNKIACYEQSVGDYFGKEALRKELAECKADAARLDYLQQGVTIDLVGKDLLFRVGGDNSSMRTTIREAIDAAMKGVTE